MQFDVKTLFGSEEVLVEADSAGLSNSALVYALVGSGQYHKGTELMMNKWTIQVSNGDGEILDTEKAATALQQMLTNYDELVTQVKNYRRYIEINNNHLESMGVRSTVLDAKIASLDALIEAAGGTK